MKLYYNKWKEIYAIELEELWKIFYKHFQEYHLQEGDWTSESNKEKFFKFVYKKSSQVLDEFVI